MRGVIAVPPICVGTARTIQRMRRELLAKVRRRLLERQAARYPLLAEQIVAEELARRKKYYAGEEEE